MSVVDPAKVAAKVLQLVTDAEMHDQIAARLQDLAEDELRESVRLRHQAASCQALLNEPGGSE